jgi:hypothetical protein
MNYPAASYGVSEKPESTETKSNAYHRPHNFRIMRAGINPTPTKSKAKIGYFFVGAGFIPARVFSAETI